MTATTSAKMTVEQFAQLQTPDTVDFELVEGELVPLSSGTPRHGRIRDLIGHLLWAHFRSARNGQSFGEVDCQVSPSTVRRPDVSVFLGDRAKEIDLDRIPVPFVPDIAIEVLSISEKAVDVNRKVREYLGGGCREVWLLDESNSEVFVHSGQGIRMLNSSDTLETDLLPGFAVQVSDLFGHD